MRTAPSNCVTTDRQKLSVIHHKPTYSTGTKRQTLSTSLKFWMEAPTTSDGWKALRDALAAGSTKGLPELRQRLGVNVENQTIGGVNCYVLTPDSTPEANRNRLSMYLQGGQIRA
jgi:hypothetical protein